jgi:succinate dehydrogenase / fumarate reductase membrane anchor subunit
MSCVFPSPPLAFVIALFWHARLGIQVVIEDYVHTPWLEFSAQIVVAFACALGALASIVAIGRLAFAA